MKIKENKEIALYNKIPLIFFLCCAVTVIVRTVQVFLFLDRETGFYQGGSFLTTLLYAVIAVASVFFALTAFMSKQTAAVTLQVKKDNLISVLGCLLAVSFLTDSVSAFIASLDSTGNISYGISAFQAMMLSGTIPKFFQSIFAVLSAVYFLIFVKGIIKGNNNSAKHKILAVAPVCWAGFRLIHRFVEQISYIRVSELFLELILLALMVMFFMAFAQMASGVYVKNARWRIAGLGLSMALISLTLNIPRLLHIILKGSDALSVKYPFSVCDFVFALFVLVLVIKIIKEEREPGEV